MTSTNLNETSTAAESSLSLSKGDRLLPEGFQPGENEVIIGRGKKVTSHCGNQRFLEVVRAELVNYSRAPSKTEKSFILAKILHQVRRWSKDRIGFVKYDSKTGRWHAPRDSVARVTVAQAFRDALSNRYSSSKHNKQRKRQIAKGYVAADDEEEEEEEELKPSQSHEMTDLSLKNVVHQGMIRNYQAQLSAADNNGMGFGNNPNHGQDTLAHIRAIVQNQNSSNYVNSNNNWNNSNFANLDSHCPNNQNMMMMMHQASNSVQSGMTMGMGCNNMGMPMGMTMPMQMGMSPRQQFLANRNANAANQANTMMYQHFPDNMEPLPIGHYDEPVPAPHHQFNLSQPALAHNAPGNDDAFFASEQTSAFFLGAANTSNPFPLH